MSPFRVGVGYDLHPLVEGRPLYIGGVLVEFEKGLLGHSDADVLLHAIADAVLGGCGLPDIGILFPASDERYRGISSRLILERALEMAGEAGFRVCFVDSVVVAQRPRLLPYLDRIKGSVESMVGRGLFNVKFKSPEGVGALGRGEAISATAVCLLCKEE